MTEEDLIGESPDAKSEQFLVVGAPATSSFELEMIEKSMIAMAAARAEFGRNDDPEWVEADDDSSAAVAPPIPLNPIDRELLDNENAVLAALSNLWTWRLAIVRATGNKNDYVAGCLADGISPF